MASAVKPIPEGYHTLTPTLIVHDADKAIAFYKQALGAKEVQRMNGPGGGIMHAELEVGDSKFFVCDEYPQMGSNSAKQFGGTPVTLFVYVKDTDAAFQRATAAGATAQMPPTDMFWGDRFAKVVDPFGMEWSFGTHLEDVSPEECSRRAKETMKKFDK